MLRIESVRRRVCQTLGFWGAGLCLALLSAPVCLAQGGHRGAQPFRGGSVIPGASFGAQGPAVIPPVVGSTPRLSHSSGSYYRGYNRGAYGHNTRGYLPLAYFAAPYYYPGYYSDNDSGGYADAAPPPSVYEPDPTVGIAAELADLHREVTEMRQAMMQGPMPENGPYPAQQAAAPQPPPPPLVLVFRDGTRTEVHDFAVIGDTFWDLSSHPTRKIALNQLNLDASIQATQARGAEFPPLPSSSTSPRN